MPAFESLERIFISGRGEVHIVRLDRDYYDFDSLVGHDVVISCVVRRCVGVERYAHSPPWRRGETVGLQVAP